MAVLEGIELSVDQEKLARKMEPVEQNKQAAIARAFGLNTAAWYRSDRASLNQHMELRTVHEHLDLLGAPCDDEQRE